MLLGVVFNQGNGSITVYARTCVYYVDFDFGYLLMFMYYVRNTTSIVSWWSKANCVEI